MRDGTTEPVPMAPLCAYCRRRPREAVQMPPELHNVGAIVYATRCQPCGAALTAARDREDTARRARERQGAEMGQRARDGLPAVLPPSVPRLAARRAGDP